MTMTPEPEPPDDLPDARVADADAAGAPAEATQPLDYAGPRQGRDATDAQRQVESVRWFAYLAVGLAIASMVVGLVVAAAVVWGVARMIGTA